MPSLTSYAEDILRHAKMLDAHLVHQQKPPPSVDHDSFTGLGPELESIRSSLVDSAHAIKQLAQGPVLATVDILFTWIDILSLRMIYTYKIPHAVPLDGTISYAAIATIARLSESTTRRFVRQAITNGIFMETSLGQVSHTAASRLMVTDPDFFDAVGLETAELAPTSGSYIDALSRFKESGEPNETAFALANKSDVGIYQILAKEPERARRFGAGMRFFTKDEGWDLKHLIAGFDWAAIDHPGAVVIDMGGGQGSVSKALAKATKHLKFIVEDLPGNVEQGRKTLGNEFKSRVEFVGHDFFTPQPFETAPDVYLFRWIFHNWSDMYCVRILQNLTDAMAKGTRILIYEYVLDDQPSMGYSKKRGLNTDIIMASCFNGAERTEGQWKQLLRMADPNLVVNSIIKPPGSRLSIIEASWSEHRDPLAAKT